MGLQFVLPPYPAIGYLKALGRALVAPDQWDPFRIIFAQGRAVTAVQEAAGTNHEPFGKLDMEDQIQQTPGSFRVEIKEPGRDRNIGDPLCEIEVPRQMYVPFRSVVYGDQAGLSIPPVKGSPVTHSTS